VGVKVNSIVPLPMCYELGFLRKAEKSIKHSQILIYTKEKGKNQRRKALKSK
jgi:hypothetical protein